MQSVHRHFGKYMKRSADSSQISVRLKDVEDADKMLTRMIDASKAWHDSSISILTYQHRLVAEFEGLYAPIIGPSSDYSGTTKSRTARLREEHEDLKKGSLDEVNLIALNLESIGERQGG